MIPSCDRVHRVGKGTQSKDIVARFSSLREGVVVVLRNLKHLLTSIHINEDFGLDAHHCTQPGSRVCFTPKPEGRFAFFEYLTLVTKESAARGKLLHLKEDLTQHHSTPGPPFPTVLHGLQVLLCSPLPQKWIFFWSK